MGDWREELYHHGIKGQKWGDRNGPPYPLNPSKYSASESRSSSGKAFAAKQLKKIQNEKVGALDPITTYYLIQAAVFVAAVATAKISSEVKYNNEIKNNVNSNDTNIQKKIEEKHTPDDDMKNINPGLADQKNMGARMNCTMCSAAYELRRRGYDVEANYSILGRKDKDSTSWFNLNSKEIPRYKDYGSFERSLQSQPDGSRGMILAGCGSFDSGHSMVWEKVNGKVIVRDCQSGKKYSSISASPVNKSSRIDYRFFRTDDAEINWDKIKDAVIERR